VSQTCKLTVFIVHWRCVFSISTRHIERIRGALCDDALYKLTFIFTFTFTWEWTTNNNRLYHWSIAPLISSSLMVSCFRHETCQTCLVYGLVVIVLDLLTIYHVLKSVPNWKNTLSRWKLNSPVLFNL